MAINFPHNPNVNDVHTESSLGKTWKWDGTTWKIYSTTTSGIGLSDISVSQQSVGTAALTYNNTSGVFTYTPPDLSAGSSRYTLPIASSTVLGGIKVGSNLTIDANGVLAGVSSYTLPTASTTVLGGVKIDGTTITITNGVISGAPSVPTTITVADESADTSCYPLFTTSDVGNLAPKTGSNFLFNSSSGQIEAGSFKKTGGSSTEFLKADGSIDSNTYSQSNHTHSYGLNDLSDVTTGTISDGDVLKYSGTNSRWEAQVDATGSSGIPSGGIIMWSGTVATIPTGWELCDGNNSTPDLRDRFIIGARQDDSGVAKTNITGSLTQTGGSKDAVAVTHGHNSNANTSNDGNHSHDYGNYSATNSGDHSHNVNGSSVSGSTNNTGSHNHVFPGDDQLSNASGQGGWNSRTTGSWPYDADSTYPNASGGQIYRTNDDGGHSHNFNFNFNANTNNTGSHSHPVNGNSGNAGSHSHNVSVSVADGGESGTNKNLPPYYALCFIMKT